MRKTAFVCFGADKDKDDLLYHELPRKSGDEEFFVFFSPGNPAYKALLSTLFRDTVSDSRLCHPRHYFNMFLQRVQRLVDCEDPESDPFNGSIIMVLLRRDRDAYILCNGDTALYLWDNRNGYTGDLSDCGWAEEISAVQTVDQTDLFQRRVEDLFRLHHLVLPEGSWTLILTTSMEWIERYHESLRNSIFFPSFATPSGNGITVETDRSFPALHWNVPVPASTVQRSRDRISGKRKVSIPLVVGSLTALLAIFIIFGPFSTQRRPQRPLAEQRVLLSTNDEQTGDSPHSRHDERRLETGSSESPPARSVVLLEAWKRIFSEPVTSSPVLSAGTLFFGCRDGHLYAYTTNGELKWKYNSGRGIGASPSCTSNCLIGANYQGTVFCLEPGTGTLRWATDLKAEIKSSPGIQDRTVFVGTMDGRIAALDIDDGTVQWSQKVGTAVWAGIRAGEDYIVSATTDGSLLRMDRGGKILWRVNPGSGIMSTPLCIEAHNMVVFGTKDSYVYAYSLTHGDLMWRFGTGARVDGSPATDGKNIYVGSADGFVYALDLSGQPIWKMNIGGTVLSRPLVAGGMLFVTSYGAKLTALRTDTGEIVSTFDASSPIYSSPCQDGERIYFGSNKGVFFALWLYGNAS